MNRQIAEQNVNTRKELVDRSVWERQQHMLPQLEKEAVALVEQQPIDAFASKQEAIAFTTELLCIQRSVKTREEVEEDLTFLLNPIHGAMVDYIAQLNFGQLLFDPEQGTNPNLVA